MKTRLYKKISIILIISCILNICTGCGNNKENIEEATIMSEEINVEQGSDAAFNIHDLTMEELYNMTPSQVESTILEGVPNWRDIFAVSENYVMKENDWEEMKHLLGYSLWGKSWIRWYRETEDKRIEEEIKNEYGGTLSENIPDDPNYIYYAPTKSFIKNMNDEEFASYMENMFNYYNYEPVDFHELNHEQLEELKQSAIENIAVEDNYYTQIIPDPNYKPSMTTTETITVSGDETTENINVEQIDSGYN